jgi:hypothetical protein
MEEALAGGQGKITPDELPQSLKEIYNISNKNRWKNKDKKRNRELENAADSTVETAEDCQRTGAGATTSATAGAGSGNDLNEGIEWIDAQNPTVEKTPEGSVSLPYYCSTLCPHSPLDAPSLRSLRWTLQFKLVGLTASQRVRC